MASVSSVKSKILDNTAQLPEQEESFLRECTINVKKHWRLYILLLPILIWFLMFMYKPMGGLLIAFKRFRVDQGILGSEFVGFYYFKQLLFGTHSEIFWRAFRNTFLISFYGLLFGFPIPIILAIFFSEITNEPYRKLTQTITYLPHFISEVTITSLLVVLIYTGHGNTGIMAKFLYSTGIVQEGIKIIEQPNYFRPLYIITGIWKEAGYSSIVYFASIMGVSPALYEAAKIDGANKIQQIINVTIPGIASTLTIMIILRIGKMLTVGYERVILLYNSNTYGTADVISSFAFRLGIEGGNSSLAAASDMFNALIGFILVVGANFISRKISENSLW